MQSTSSTPEEDNRGLIGADQRVFFHLVIASSANTYCIKFGQLRGDLKIVKPICIEVNQEFISNFESLSMDGKLKENLKPKLVNLIDMVSQILFRIALDAGGAAWSFCGW